MKALTQVFMLGLLSLMACTPIPKSAFVGTDGGKGRSTQAVNGDEADWQVITIIPKRNRGVNPQPGGGRVLPQKPTLEWLTPNGTMATINIVADKITVRVKITSATPIELGQLEILVDGKASGNKADEVNLLEGKGLKDHILEFPVTIPEGQHKVQVVLAMSGEEQYVTERSFFRDVAGVRMLPTAVVASNTRVTWISPDVIVLGNKILSTKERELEVKFTITSPFPLEKKHFRIAHNQIYRQPSNQAVFKAGGNGNYSFTDRITLNDQIPLNEIALRVEEPSGHATSDPLKVNFSPERPNLHVLAVGPQLNLKYAARDASDFARAMSGQGKRAFGLFKQVTVDTLVGAAATTTGIRLAIAALRKKLETGVMLENDVLILFFSTHGFMDGEELYLQANDYQSFAATDTSIPYQSGILSKINELPCRKLIFIDACHSGGAKSNTAAIAEAIKKMKGTKNGTAVFTSSSSSELSYEDALWRNGAFTEAILQGLISGKADTHGYGNDNGIVTLNELEKYVKKAVPSMVATVKNQVQTPSLTRNELNNFPLFIYH